MESPSTETTSAEVIGPVMAGAVTSTVIAQGAAMEGGNDQDGGAEGYRGDEYNSDDHEPEQPRGTLAGMSRVLWPLGAGVVGGGSRSRGGAHGVGLLSVRCFLRR
jgi:hypothetical protein